ncbi:c-type cytochrome [Paragemmobacter straminiformis]|nr:c-type cytochrome [Gemmobacter straminiformis]
MRTDFDFLPSGMARAAGPMLSLLLASFGTGAAADDAAQIERGRYLVQIAGCGDCHTPGHFLGQPDMDRFLGGSDVGFEVPGVGVVYGPNLTPDTATGLGGWSADEIVAAIRTRARPDGRGLVPVMPWPNLGTLTDGDAYAIAAYLQSLDPVSNKVPGPIPEGEAAPSFVMRVIPPAG